MNSSFSFNISLLKIHLLNLGKNKMTGSPQTFAWYRSHGAPPPPPPPKMAPAPPQPLFKLNPKKEMQSTQPHTLLEQLKQSVEGVTFYENPLLPKKMDLTIVCKEEERPYLEKLSQAIDQKIMPCTLSTTYTEKPLLFSTDPAHRALYILPPIETLQDLAVKQQVWKEIKACLSKYC